MTYPSCSNYWMDLRGAVDAQNGHFSVFAEFGRSVGVQLDFFIDFGSCGE